MNYEEDYARKLREIEYNNQQERERLLQRTDNQELKMSEKYERKSAVEKDYTVS